MKRPAVLFASLAAALLSAVGCASPTAPNDTAAKRTQARAADAKSQLEGASSRNPTSGRIAIN